MTDKAKALIPNDLRIVLISIISAVITGGLIYLFGCFGTASFNISNWRVETRVYLGFTGLACAVIALITTISVLKLKN